MAADDRLSGARNLGVLNGVRVRTFKNSVGLRDKNDYYAFTITRRSSFNLSLNGLQNNVDVSLIQNNGRTIASSSKDNSKSEKITGTLEAGTYYVRIYQKRGESKYQLRLKTTSLSSTNTLYAYDGFDYPLRSALRGLNGGTGWSSSWNADALIVSGLGYTDAAGNVLPVAGGALATNDRAYYSLQTRNTLQTFDTTGGSVWLSFLVKQSAEPLRGVNYAEAGLGLTGGYVKMLGGITDNPGILDGGDDIGINPYFAPNTLEYRLSNVAPANSVSFIVLRYDFTPSGNDTINLWLNPLLGANPGAPNVSGAFSDHRNPISGITLAHGDYRTFVFDEVRIGSSYAAVTGSG